MNSEIDSSEAKAAGEGLLGDLASFASAAGTSSDLLGVADPSTTLKARDDSKSMFRKEQKFENRSTNENHCKDLTSFNWAFATGERFKPDCKPCNVNFNSTTTCQRIAQLSSIKEQEKL